MTFIKSAFQPKCVFILANLCFLAHLVYQTKSLCNHALSVIVSVSVSVAVGVICVQSSQPHGQTLQKLHIWCKYAHMLLVYAPQIFSDLSCGSYLGTFSLICSLAYIDNHRNFIIGMNIYVLLPDTDYFFSHSDLQFSNSSHFDTFL